MILSLTLYIIGVVAYSIKELRTFKKLKWMDEKNPYGFWGEHSDKRKYKTIEDYHFTKKPAFFLSTTWLVFLTDGFHLMQLIFKVLLIGSLVMYQEMFHPFWDAVLYFVLWQVTFPITYKLLSK